MTIDRKEQSPDIDRPFSTQITLDQKGTSFAIDDNAGIGYMGNDTYTSDYQKFIVVKHLRRTSVSPSSRREAETEGAQWIQFFVSHKVGGKFTIGEKYEVHYDNNDSGTATLTIRSTDHVVAIPLPAFSGLTSTLKRIHKLRAS